MNKKIIQAPLFKLILTSNSLKANFVTNVQKKLENLNQTTVDSNEVKKHSRLSKEWWDLNGPMKALHSFNHVRVPFIRDGLISCLANERTLLPLKNKSILDVGCGGGILSEPLSRLGANVTGIDASRELVELAQEHSQANQNKLSNKPLYICTTIEEHSCNLEDTYDGVVASEIIEHVNDKELFVKSCVHTLKPGGRIFFTTPNRTRLSQILGICVSEYILNIVPRGTHDFEKFTTPNELTFILERNNCHVEAVFGIMYYPILNKWEWVNSPTLMFALQAVKCEEQLE